MTFKLYTHECCECGNAVSYSLEPDVMPDSMCNDCASSFVNVAHAMGVNTYDQHERAVTPDSIVKLKWCNRENWEYFARVQINRWRAGFTK